MRMEKKMNNMTKLQLAIDTLSLEEALELLKKVSPYIDIAEVGTPLLYRSGLEAVRKIREAFPELYILCDGKIMDAGAYESGEQYEAGANCASVLGVTDDATIQACVEEAKKYGTEVSVAQEVEIKDDDGKKVIGYKPDMHKSVKFDYDTILRHYTKKDKDGNVSFWAEVIKDRTNVTKIGQHIENPCFDIWKGYYDSMNGLEVNKTSYKNDLKTSTESMVDKADKAEDLANEWKEMMKQLKEDKNMDAISKINNLIKEKKIDVKKIEMQTVEDLTELVDFTKLQLA